MLSPLKIWWIDIESYHGNRLSSLHMRSSLKLMRLAENHIRLKVEKK